MIGPKRFPNYLLALGKQDDSNSCYSIGISNAKATDLFSRYSKNPAFRLAYILPLKQLIGIRKSV